MTKHIARLTEVENLLLIQNKVIDVDELRKACASGIPESLRPLCWRLFLDYLPKEREVYSLGNALLIRVFRIGQAF
jgi:hypothetical protein